MCAKLLDPAIVQATSDKTQISGVVFSAVFLVVVAALTGLLGSAKARLAAEARRLADLVAAREHTCAQAHAVLEASLTAVILVSPAGRVLIVNRRVQDFLDVDPEGLVGQDWCAFLAAHPGLWRDPARVGAFVSGAMANPRATLSEDAAQREGGRELHVFTTPVLADDGGDLGRLFKFRDVTQERAVDRMKSEFVSLVSHELRTPLTSIKGYVDLLIDGEVGDVPPEQREFLNIVKSNADRLVALINDLLDISRIESGRIELKCQPLDLAQLVRAVAASLRPQIDAKRQILSLDLPDDLPPALADRDRVMQILTNLLGNAHKYTPEAGFLGVALRRDDRFLRVDVRDSGVGITPEEQALLFTKFFRAKNRATEEAGGTGLGLAITRSLVEMHGGEISVTSAPGRGSAFTFTLPATTPAAPSPTGNAPLTTAEGRILVVEDEPDIANLIKRYLKRGGFEVVLAHTGAEALELASRGGIQLITLDVRLPDTDGFAVLERLKSDPATAALPVLMLSMLPDDGRGRLLGAVGYLTKPVDERELLESVRRVIGGRSPLVLVADDEPDVRALIAVHLHRRGYQVVEASDGAEAVALARRLHPGLALLDIRMPLVDGITALCALRGEPDTRDLPVLMMTGHQPSIERGRAMLDDLGNSALMAKPFTAEELAEAIGQALRKHRQGTRELVLT